LALNSGVWRLRLLGMGDTSAVRLLAPPVLNLSSCPIFRVHFKVLVTRLSKPVVQTLVDKLNAIKPQLEAKFKVELVGHEGPDFLFYRKGGFYGPHRDREGDDSHRRQVTVVIFVNGEHRTGNPDAVKIDTYEGGNLVFYNLLEGERLARLGLSLTGHPGLLVAFDSAVIHEVKPVTRGERVTIVTWFLGE